MKTYKIIIDTNVLYHYLDISINPKLKDFKFEEYDLYITSVSLIEAIIHFQKDINKIEKLLKPIIEEEITLIGMRFLPLSNNEINCLYYDIDTCLKNKEDIINSLLELKIEQEAGFLRWFYIMIFDVTSNMMISKRGYNFEEIKKQEYFYKTLHIMKESNLQYIYTLFQEELKTGYLENSSSDKALMLLYDLLDSTLLSFFIFYYEVKYNGKVVDKNNSLSKDLLDKISSEFNSDKYVESIKNKTFFKNIKKKSYNDNYLNSIKNIIKELNHDEVQDRLKNIGLRFIESLLKKIFIDGSKLRKNDIEDFLITQSLNLDVSDDKYLFLTLDKKFINLIEDTHPKSFEFAQKLGLTKK